MSWQWVFVFFLPHEEGHSGAKFILYENSAVERLEHSPPALVPTEGEIPCPAAG